jgi:hypothetical protein
VFDPSQIQHDSLGFVQQTENYPPQLVCFFPKDNPATAPNDRNVFSFGDLQFQSHDALMSVTSQILSR